MKNKPKLFSISILDDAEFETVLGVGLSKEEVENRIWDEYNNSNENSPYSCLMGVRAYEVKEVDGYYIELINTLQ